MFISSGETPEEAVAREIEEEMGILRHNFRIFPEVIKIKMCP